MATVGGGAAYQQLRVPENGALAVLGNLTKIEAGKRAAEKLADERDKKRKKEIEDKYFSSLPDPNVEAIMTKQESLDHVNTNFSMITRDAMVEDLNKAKDFYTNGDVKQAKKYEALANKRLASFNELNKLSEQIVPLVQTYQKNIKTYNPNDKRRLAFNDAFVKNNVIPFSDEEGNLKVLVGIDKDGDGEISDEERQKADEYTRGGNENGDLKYEVISAYDYANKFYEPFKKVEITGKDGVLDEMAASIGIVTKDEKTGSYNISTTSGFDDNKYQQLRNNVESKLQDPETLASVINNLPDATITLPDGTTKQIKGDKSRVEFDEKDDAELIQNAVDYITQQTIAKYPSSEANKFLTSKYATDSRAATTRGKKSENSASDAILVKDATGLASQQLLEKYPNSTNGKIKAYTVRTQGGKPPKGLLSDRPNSEMLALVLAEDGTIHANYRDVKDITDTEKEIKGIEETVDNIVEGGTNTTSRIKRKDTFVDTRELLDEEIARVATFYGVGDREGLINYLNSIGGDTDFGKLNNKQVAEGDALFEN